MQPSGKKTLAVRLGDRRTRLLYVALLAVALLVVVVAALGWTPAALITLVAFIPVAPPIGAVTSGASGRDLISVLATTGQIQLIYGVTLGIGLAARLAKSGRNVTLRPPFEVNAVIIRARTLGKSFMTTALPTS